MNELITTGRPGQKMTSMEIAELVESRHDKVKQSIERLAKRGVIGLPPMGENPTSEIGGRPGTVFLLDKRSSLIVVAQLSPKFTARVVDRWQELEQTVADQPQNNFQLPDFTNPAIAARAWADEVEQKQVLVGSLQRALSTITELTEIVERHISPAGSTTQQRRTSDKPLDYKCRTILAGAISSINIHKRPTIKIIQHRRPAVRTWTQRDIDNAITELEYRGLIEIDNSKRTPAYYPSNS